MAQLKSTLKRLFPSLLRRLGRGPTHHWHQLRPQNKKILSGWAEAQMKPWLSSGTKKYDLQRKFAELNDSDKNIIVADFTGDSLIIRKKSKNYTYEAWMEFRIESYRFLVERVALEHGISGTFTIAYDVRDQGDVQHDAPIFVFQKSETSGNLLLPDPDFFTQNWYENRQDWMPYRKKVRRAVFAGASSGTCGGLTVEIVRNDQTPRLKLAAEAINHSEIDITIRAAVEYTTPEAKSILESKAYFIKSWISLSSQFENRFMISIDGNGPTCSRVVHTLLSNSILLKHHDNFKNSKILFYYYGMQSGVHYLPFSSISDIETILDHEKNGKIPVNTIRRNAQRFARTYLSRDAVEFYLATVLKQYTRSFFS